MVKIFLDPGHGGSDAGAVANGLQEKHLTLQIAKNIESILKNEYENVTIRMSRTGDQTVSLSARTNAANSWGADFYLSVHINAGGGTGFESFVYPYAPNRTRNEHEDIHTEIMKQVDFRDRGMKEANFHVLRETNMSAVLTESGFIDTVADANKLKDPNYIQRVARGHVNGLAKALGLKKKTVSQPAPQPNPGRGNSLYKVQLGAFKDRGNAEDLVNRAKKAGFDVFIAKENNLYKVQIGAYSVKENALALADKAKNAGFTVYIAKD